MRGPRRGAAGALVVTLALGALAACGPVPLQRLGGYQPNPCSDLAGPAPAPPPLGAALTGASWVYQLQEASPTEIAAAGFDIAVVDYSINGEESGRYSSAEMVLLNGGGSRTVLAYLSIGEAESYRYYFDPRWVSLIGGQPTSAAPCWLGRTNPDWEGNYKVQYWSEQWQQIVLGYLDRIMADGFDGVYLDIIDAYEYWSDPDNREGYTIGEAQAAERMIEWVLRLAYHARTEKGIADFAIVPQNGEGILAYDSGDRYLAAISAIGIEDLYYDGTVAVSPAETAARKQFLDPIAAGKPGIPAKPVLVVDYVDDGSRPPKSIVDTFRGKALTDGYVPYPARTDRELDEINQP